MGISHFGLFVVATFLLNITPGNDFIFVVTQTFKGGAKAGVISSFGISLGLLLHVSASVLGLSILLSRSIVVYDLIKWLGGAYLIYLGIRSILSKSRDMVTGINPEKVSTRKLLSQGFLTNVFNPKVALFFLSFLPQFATGSSPNFAFQLLLLGAWFIFSGLLVSIGIAVLFSKLRNLLTGFKLFWSLQHKITGLVFICLGLKIALSNRK
jgi:threonine/homoserine/homoserine lactone efflux protein